MEDKQNVLEQLEKLSRKQVRFARIQCIFSIVAAVCCLALVLWAVRILPQFRQAAETAQSLAGQAETVLTNLKSVTQELSQADIGSVVTNVDALVTTSQAGIEEAMEKISAIDIEALNQAIEDLNKVIEPLAKMANIFR